ncbi:MarR family winged helix-turn-helix transcriptional regulator [Dongia sp.]|uniref:MarR family winged helix-turn-helix transcriptional regulator n=1 Tax=Dongia sp. TaxID=1977262 RepID=UPI003753DAD1
MTKVSQSIRAGDVLKLDNQLCFAVYAAAHAFNATYKPLLEPLGLTYPQYLVMLVLWQEDRVTVSAIGGRLGLDSGTLTPLLKRLEAAGLVSRLRDAADERQVRISLTAAGRALKQKAKGIPQDLFCALGLNLGEITALRGKLESLAANLRAHAAESA